MSVENGSRERALTERGLRVRRAEPIDVEPLRRVQNGCFPHPWSAADIGAQLALTGAVGVVAVDGLAAVSGGVSGEIVGYALGQRVVDEVELRSIAVLPQWRRRGTGRVLMTSFLKTAQEQGGRCAFLEVAVDEPAAIRLYLSFGFIGAGKRTGYYRVGRTEPVDALIMTLEHI